VGAKRKRVVMQNSESNVRIRRRFA
jgi:hypothetical protein